jgi:peptidoglycan/LPS O-acetylase OafA/YrhL
MYKSLQACRGYAALLVVLLHLGLAIASPKYFGLKPFAVPFSFGDAGVEFFFVLSGFIITWVHFSDFGQPARLRDYLRKRVVRIYPAYWIVLAAVFLPAAAVPALRSTVPHDLPTLLKSAALIPQDPAVVGGTGAPILIVAWSLQYEICFYCLAATFIVNRAFGILVSIGWLGNALACQWGSCAFPRSFFANPVILLFAVGALIAYCSKLSIRLKRPAIVAAAAACAFLSLGAAEAIWGRQLLPFDRRLAYGLISGVLIFALVRAEDSDRPAHGQAHGQAQGQGQGPGQGERQAKRQARRWTALLGDSSYALYLIHYPLISLLCKFGILAGLRGPAGAVLAYLSILCACVAAAIAFHIAVEKPVMRALSGRASAAAPP